MWSKKAVIWILGVLKNFVSWYKEKKLNVFVEQNFFLKKQTKPTNPQNKQKKSPKPQQNLQKNPEHPSPPKITKTQTKEKPNQQ